MTSQPCTRVLDDLASLVDGDFQALERHLDHLEQCDTCQDARHEASMLATAISAAGADFVVPDDLAEQSLQRIAQESRTPDPERPPTQTPTDNQPTAKRRTTWAFGLAAAGALVAGTVGVQRSMQRTPPATAAIGTSATLSQIDRAANDGQAGVIVKGPGGNSLPTVATGEPLAPGSTIQTDERTRAALRLHDGSRLILNHLTMVTLDRERPRSVRVDRGELVAHIAHRHDEPHAMVRTATSHLEVLGTTFALTANNELTSVRVTRGQVKLSGEHGDSVVVHPGEEGIVEARKAPHVAAVVNLAKAVSWSELVQNPSKNDHTTAGIGELRAYKPGEQRDRDWALKLQDHRVTVRIAGNIARTEIEETFQNDSNTQLEGVYRFPLPPDARIDKLALDVNGTFLEGAFVEKSRASKIWRGVIHKATARRKVRRPEIIWVPGPWKDPALLEWKRGGRFELRIFPIPAKGSRTIRIAYTQTVKPHGSRRRYVYPLPHSADGSTSAEQFDVNIRVTGAEDRQLARVHGYEFQRNTRDSTTELSFSRRNFVPHGNIVVEYALPNRHAELRSWTFQGDAAAAPNVRRTKRGTGASQRVIDAQAEVARDDRATVLFALKPKLPRWTESKLRDYVFVVDSSQSMYGERYSRARKLVRSLIGEMDRRDRFMTLACDTECSYMTSTFQAPTPEAADKVATWLDEREPAGASDLSWTLQRAATLAQNTQAPNREMWLLYVGDGVASMGHTRAAALSDAAKRIANGHGIRINTVGVGGDANVAALTAIARASGGFHVPYRPGDTPAMAALSVLETTYGVRLENPVVTVPSEIDDVGPTLLPTIRAGEELLIAGRFSGEVRGDIVVTGTVGGRPYENRYPIELTPSRSQGNAFVPRMWAALTIDKLELEGRGEDWARIVGLSKAYGVLSKHTSLLVLESDAMFKAFGVDRNTPAAYWTGDVRADGSVSTSSLTARTTRTLSFDEPDDDSNFAGTLDSEADALASAAGMAVPRHGAKQPRRSKPRRPREKQSSKVATEMLDNPLRERKPRATSPRPTGRRGPRGGQWMKKVWYRAGAVTDYRGVSESIQRAVSRAQQTLSEKPNSRAAHRSLVQALSYAGDLDRAYAIAAKWLARDRLDPEALIYMSDVLGRQGRREQALRLLSGVVDIRPDSVRLHERLANAYARAGDNRRACAHRVSLSEIRTTNVKSIAAAIRCQRATGQQSGADRTVAAVPEEGLRGKVLAAATIPAVVEQAKGEMLVSASWQGGSNIDISVITPQGTRLSWMGGRRGVRGSDASDLARERLALRRITKGNYLIEINRTDPSDQTPITGTVSVRILGKRKRMPFTLTGDRLTVGRIRVHYKSRLVAM